MEKPYQNYNFPKIAINLLMTGLLITGSYMMAKFTEDCIKPQIKKNIENIILQNKK
jgi:hypothetical protein